METRIGAYFVQGTGINSEKRQAAYDEVLDSFTITDKMDEEVYAQNTGQAGELLFPLSGWDPHRKHTWAWFPTVRRRIRSG